MKLKQLESMLGDLEQFSNPKVELEQYPTGPHIASRMLYTYYFEGRFNLVKFIKIIQQAGMHMILRIGPFVEAQYNCGHANWGTNLVALHSWHRVQNDTKPFKYHVQKFMTLIVDMMKKEKLFAS